MSHILIIQNDKLEGAGVFIRLLGEREIAYTVIPGTQVSADDHALRAYDALMILGGAQAVYELDVYPYLEQEIHLCRHYFDVNKPVFCICLGGQIMAAALGAKVKPNSQKELGWHELRLTEQGTADPLFAAYPEVSPAFHFHGDFFELPADCVSLASSDMTVCQAFRYGDCHYGFQYHCEVDLPLVELICRSNADYMQASGSDPEQVIAQSKTQLPAYQNQCHALISGWLDRVKCQVR